MALPAETLNDLLLDLLSPKALAGERLAHWQSEDWQHLLMLCRQHRLGPLLHWRLEHEQAGVVVPESVRQFAHSAFKLSSLRALQAQREWLLCHQVLQQAGIPCLALKGAYLAQAAYPHPALRPMRDLDVLVPSAQGLQAFNALLAAGYRRVEGHDGDPAVCLQYEKDLPCLKSPSGMAVVELHVRLCSSPDLPADDDLHESVWQRAIQQQTAGVMLAYPCAEDLLLHIAIHAAYEHRFNNGPLILPDMAYLIRCQSLNWALFWELANTWGASRGVALLLSAVEHYYGDLAIQRLPSLGDAATTARQVRNCVQLMLGDARVARMVPVAARLSGKTLRQKLKLLWRELMPSAHRVQAEDQRAQFWLPRLWTRFKRPFSDERMAEFRRSRQDPDFGHAVKRYVDLDAWLTCPTHRSEPKA